jgi:hypothetical protein
MMGLAVRVDGRLLCQLCVDTLLPAEQQVVINRARALKGLPTTTYKMTLEQAPELGLFTFTTAAQMSIHRRSLRGEMEFATPPLPPPGAPSQVGRMSSAHNLRGEAQVADREASGTGRMVAVVAVVGAVALLAGLSCLLLPGTSAAPATHGTTTTTTTTSTAPTPSAPVATASASGTDATTDATSTSTSTQTAKTIPQRGDYPSEALAAWRACRDDRACPPELQTEIADEVSAAVTRTLDRVQAELDNSERVDALSLLANAAIPSDQRFSELRARRDVLGTRLRDSAIASASPAATADDASATATTAATAMVVTTTTPADATPATASATAPATADDLATLPKFGDNATTAATDVTTPVFSGPTGTAVPGRDDWTFAVAELPPSPGAMLEGSLLQRGTLKRILPAMSAGTYQIWIEASPTAGTDTLTVTAGAASTTLVGSALPASGGWIAVGAPVPIEDGPLKISVTAVGGPWRLGRVHIAGSDQAPPTVGIALSSPWSDAKGPLPKQQPETAGTTPATTLSAPTATGAAVVASAKKIMPWTPVFQWPAGAKPVLPTADSLLPSPWPSGVEPFHASQMFGSSGVMTLKLKLSRARISGGGLVLALNRGGHWERKQLDATFEDGHTAISLPPFKFADNNDWQTMVITAPDLGSLAENCWLTLADHDALGSDNGFMLGAVTTVTGGAPVAADLGLLPAPLLAKDVILSLPWRHTLVDMLNNAVGDGARKWTDPRTFDPLRLRVFSGDLADTANGPAWAKAFANEMKDSYRTLGHKDSGLMATMQMSPGWYEGVQFNGTQPAIDNGCALVVVMPGALLTEAPSSLEAWWTDLAAKIAAGDRGDHNHRGGFLAVLVVGSAIAQDDATRAGEAPMWKRLVDRAALVGTPVIDLRPAQQVPPAKVTGASARMLVDGLRQLAYQIDLTQKMP